MIDLIDAMGGEGEFVYPATAHRLWAAFSASWDTAELDVNAGTLGNFAAWLILTQLTPALAVAETATRLYEREVWDIETGAPVSERAAARVAALDADLASLRGEV